MLLGYDEKCLLSSALVPRSSVASGTRSVYCRIPCKIL